MKFTKIMLPFISLAISTIVTSCASTGGLTDNAKNNVPTRIWHDNAILLVEANDPDMKADTFIGVPQLDAVVDSVKDVLVQVPIWTTTKVEQKQFRNMYLESAKALNAGADGAELIVKSEAFKTALLLDTFTQEVAHSKAAVVMSAADKKMHDFATRKIVQSKFIFVVHYKILDEAVAKATDYANNQIFTLVTCSGDAAHREFFAVPERQQWNARTDEIIQIIKGIISNAEDEKQAETAISELGKAMGVQEVDWNEVGIRLAGDLVKLQNAALQFAEILKNDSALQTKIAQVAFGGEIVQGISGKETLGVITRVSKQIKVNIKLLKWLISTINE